MLRVVTIVTVSAACGLLTTAGCVWLTNTDDLAGGSAPGADASNAADATTTIDATSQEADAEPTGIVYRGVQIVAPLDGTTLQIAPPTTVQAGDFMLLALFQYEAKAVVSGLDERWRAVTTLDPAGQDGSHGIHSLRIFWKIAGLEPRDYRVVLEAGGAPSVSGILAAWGGVDRLQPLDVQGAVTKDFPPLRGALDRHELRRRAPRDHRFDDVRQRRGLGGPRRYERAGVDGRVGTVRSRVARPRPDRRARLQEQRDLQCRIRRGDLRNEAQVKTSIGA